MIKKLILIFVLLIFCQLSAQEEKSGYPFSVLGGETIKTPASQDTLWILKHSQYKKYVKESMKYELKNKEISLLKKKIGLKELLSAEKDSLIIIYKDGYGHYRGLWTETDKKLETARIQASKRWLYLQYGILGGVLFTVGLVVFAKNI